MSNQLGEFIGVGVGPGEAGMIPYAAWKALQGSDIIFVPRAKSSDYSVAKRCLDGMDIPEDRYREVEFDMEEDRDLLGKRYATISEQIAVELESGKRCAYLTIGDSMTYSTYAYTLAALKKRIPNLKFRTFPGVTSYCALAAATGFALGEGKEKVLIVPCPDEMSELKKLIDANDIVVLMKIAGRLEEVVKLLKEMGIASRCVYGKRVGMPEEWICPDVSLLIPEKGLGYLGTLLIRKRENGLRF